MENISTAYQLIAGNGGVAEQNCDDPKNTRGLVIASFEQIRNRKLGKFSCTRRDKVDQQQAGPAAPSLPKRGKSMLISILGPAKQRARTNPARQQREHQNKRRQRAACHKVVGLGLHLAKTGERNRKQADDNNR
jgi:hypothetical protein